MSDLPNVMKLKVCMAGEGAVGKTSLIRRYVLDEYEDRYTATLGTKITKKPMMTKDPAGAPLSVDLILWDIMGTSTLRELLKEAYYHGAKGILAVADLTRRETLVDLDGWARSIRSVAGDIPTYAVLNKADLDAHRRLPHAEAEAFFRERAWPWTYTSAKTGAGVEEAFRGLVARVLESTL
jgi:hypothetical protein